MTEQEKHILQNAKKQFYQKEIAYIKTRQGAFESHLLHFDHPLFAGGVSLVASDNGEAAEKIRKNVEVCPLWLSLWRNAYTKLPPKGKRVLYALMQDWRTTSAAKLAGVSRPTIIEWKHRFRTYFFTSYRAWRNLN